MGSGSGSGSGTLIALSPCERSRSRESFCRFEICRERRACSGRIRGLCRSNCLTALFAFETAFANGFDSFMGSRV